MQHVEHAIQSGFFDWVRLMEHQQPVLKLMFAVPNGGRRDARTGARLKREGVRAGVLDTFLLASRGGFTGLAMEFKRPGGKLNKKQKEFIESLKSENWCVSVVTDIDTAIKTVISYLAL